MEKIINNRRYNTATATSLGIDGGGDGFREWREELFRKRNGEFFLYGQGGPMTKYAHQAGGNCWCEGEKITPLAPEEARQWAEEHLDTEEYMEIFGDPGEGDEKITICIQIPAALDATIRRNAAEQKKSMTAYITKILEKAHN